MNQMSHYFLGIPVDEKLKPWFAEWQQALKGNVSYKSWTNPEDLHITLKFLGATSEEQIKKLINELANLDAIKEFSIKVGNLGFFGKKDQPRVMWAGVEKTPELNALQSEVENICRLIHFPIENRPFKPHITLAKKWRDDQLHIDVSDVRSLLNSPLDMVMQVNEFHLYQIHPQKQVKYEPVYTYKLK